MRRISLLALSFQLALGPSATAGEAPVPRPGGEDGPTTERLVAQLRGAGAAAAARQLGARGAVEATAEVALLLGDPNVETRETAREALRALSALKGCGPALVEARQRTSGEARALLVGVLGTCPEAEARSVWASSLGDPDASVRAAADRSLRLASASTAGMAVAGCLDGSVDAERLACTQFAREQKLAAALPRLAAVAAWEVGAPDVRAAASAAVREMVDDLDAPALAEKAREAPDRSDRAEALQLLALVPGERTFVALSKALEDPDEFVRQVAASSLGEFGDLRGVKPLSKALSQPANTRIRKAIQRAIDRLTKGGGQR